MKSAIRGSLWVMLLVSGCVAQPNYPFGFTAIGQSTGFASLCSGNQVQGQYALYNLSTGFPTVVTGGSWNGTATTLTYPASGGSSGGAPPANGEVIYVVGVTPSGYNGGPFTITSATSTSVTYNQGSNPGSYVSGGMVETSYPYDCDLIIPWSSGSNAVDASGNPIFVVGVDGGHNDTEENSVFSLGPLNSTSATWTNPLPPTTPVPFQYDGQEWEGICPYPYTSQSFVAPWNGGVPTANCAGGVQVSPASRHTYDGVAFDPVNGLIYTFGGSLANSGYLSEDLWTLNPATTPWAWTLQQTQLSTGGGLGYSKIPTNGAAHAGKIVT